MTLQEHDDVKQSFSIFNTHSYSNQKLVASTKIIRLVTREHEKSALGADAGYMFKFVQSAINYWTSSLEIQSDLNCNGVNQTFVNNSPPI